MRSVESGPAAISRLKMVWLLGPYTPVQLFLMNHWLGSTNKVIMARDSLTGLLVEVEGTMVAHLFRLMAGDDGDRRRQRAHASR